MNTWFYETYSDCYFETDSVTRESGAGEIIIGI